MRLNPLKVRLNIEQESIPLGCVKPAFVVGGRVYPSPWIPYRPSDTLHPEHGTRATLPPMNRLTDSWENITFPQLLLLAVKPRKHTYAWDELREMRFNPCEMRLSHQIDSPLLDILVGRYFTVFVPSEAAIQKLPSGIVDQLMKNKTLLMDTLTFHILRVNFIDSLVKC